MLFIPAGNWAEWAGAAAAGLSLLILSVGRRRDLQRSATLERSAQARLIGGWIDFEGTRDGPDGVETRVQLTVQNASPLAVRKASGYVMQVADQQIRSIPEIPVLRPGPYESSIWIPNCPSQLILILVFDDDAGERWRKYSPRTKKPRGGLTTGFRRPVGSTPMDLVKPGQTDLHGVINGATPTPGVP